MWQQVIDLIKKSLSLADDVDRNKEDIEQHRGEIKEIRQEIKQLNDKVDRVILEFYRLSEQLSQARQNEQHEREKLVLQLKIAMLEFERRLPPSKDEPKP